MQFFTQSTVPAAVVIGNSIHPVSQVAVSLMAKPLPQAQYEGLYVIRLKDDKGAFTYRRQDHSIQFHDIPWEEFKRRVKAGEPLNSSYETVDIPDTDKYIGNAIYREVNYIGV